MEVLTNLVDIVDVKCVKDVSKKTGNSYNAIVIEFENGYKKMIFLTDGDLYRLDKRLQ